MPYAAASAPIMMPCVVAASVSKVAASEVVEGKAVHQFSSPGAPAIFFTDVSVGMPLLSYTTMLSSHGVGLIRGPTGPSARLSDGMPSECIGYVHPAAPGG